MTIATAIRRPSGYLPIGMSLLALCAVLLRLAIVGTAPEFNAAGRPDEGPVAHLWQMLMLGQVPIVLYIAIRWLRKYPMNTLVVLGLRLLAVLAAMTPVYLLHW